MEVAFIVNPAAGHGRGAREWVRVQAALAGTGYHYRAYITAGPRDAVRLAREAARTAEVVAAFGGDGTLHEVLNGIQGTGSMLGVVPAGTGNDFCLSAGIPHDPVQAALGLYRPTERLVDCGWAGSEAFLNVAGLGLDAAVCRSLARWRWLPRHLRYLAALVENLIRLSPWEIELSLDGSHIAREVLLIAVANGSTFGGGMRIAPGARLDDGLFQVVLIRPVSRTELLRVLPLVYQGRHVTHPAVEILAARTVTVTASAPLPVQAEGELLGTTPVTFTLEPQRVALAVPSA